MQSKNDQSSPGTLPIYGETLFLHKIKKKN